MQKILKDIFSPKWKLNRVEFIISLVFVVLMWIIMTLIAETIYGSVIAMAILTIAFALATYVYFLSHFKRLRDLQWSAFIILLVLILNPFLTIAMVFIPWKNK